MLVKDSKSIDWWCFEENSMIYIYYNMEKYQKLQTPFETKAHIASGKNTLLGPVCLGFWRG
jgi:hypothetical protein